MKPISAKTKLLPLGLCGLGLGITGAAQSPAISVSPTTSTLSVGQTQQFTTSGAVTATGVSSGGEYTCVRLSDATVRCTGRNQFKQLANGTWDNSPVLVASSLTNVNRVIAGDEYACALLNDGTVSCWGLGESGQRGDGLFTTMSDPVAVTGITGA